MKFNIVIEYNVENVNDKELNKDIEKNAEFIAKTEKEILTFMLENGLKKLELPNGSVIEIENLE